MNTQQVNKIEVYGKRWFQRSYGNTYHTASIYVDNICVANLGRAYGYGEFYIQRAAQFLNENGYITLETKTQALWSYCRENNIELEYSAEDVKRQRDL